MRVLVLSDIHANLTALEAVLAEAGEIDATWCLGDVVGYGPDPNECIQRLRDLPSLVSILGNHDVAALHNIGVGAFNPEARQAINWTQKTLNQSSLEFLGSLHERASIGEATLAHGSPRSPIWEYILDTYTATLNFEYFPTAYCFVGHTHLPIHYTLLDGETQAAVAVPEPNQVLTLKPRSIINPGSVGQPRDRDRRAAYAIYHPENSTWDYRRVEYDIAHVQQRMRTAGLPERHISRLQGGW